MIQRLKVEIDEGLETWFDLLPTLLPLYLLGLGIESSSIAGFFSNNFIVYFHLLFFWTWFNWFSEYCEVLPVHKSVLWLSRIMFWFCWSNTFLMRASGLINPPFKLLPRLKMLRSDLIGALFRSFSKWLNSESRLTFNIARLDFGCWLNSRGSNLCRPDPALVWGIILDDGVVSPNFDSSPPARLYS